MGKKTQQKQSQQAYQHTLKTAIEFRGVGLHSGQSATLVARPAHPGTGIRFIRTDLKNSPEIIAHHSNVVATQLATTLGKGEAKISTVEHVLAAFQGMGVDNVVLEVNGPEVPILDGSSAPFMDAIRKAGVVAQAMVRPTLVLRQKVEVKVGEKWAVAEPAARLEVHGSIEWDHPSIGYQEFHYIEGQTSFDEIASARTFCLLRDVEMMQKMGLARGGSLDNAVVLDHANVLNPGGLRYSDELVRHKVLDALGDFKLAGFAIQGYVRLHRAGHELHNQLLATIFSNPDNYEIIGLPTPVTAEDKEDLRIALGARRLLASVS